MRITCHFEVLNGKGSSESFSLRDGQPSVIWKMYIYISQKKIGVVFFCDAILLGRGGGGFSCYHFFQKMSVERKLCLASIWGLMEIDRLPHRPLGNLQISIGAL